MWAIKQIKSCLWVITRVFWAITRYCFFSKYFKWEIATLLPTSTIVNCQEKCEVLTILWEIVLMSDHKHHVSDQTDQNFAYEWSQRCFEWSQDINFSQYFQSAMATLLPTSTTIVYSKKKYKVSSILWEIVLMSDRKHHVSDQRDQNFAYEWSQECFERSQDIDFFQIFSVSNSHPFTHIHHYFIQHSEI